MNNLIVFLLVIDLLQGIKWIIFMKQSTTTRMESNELDHGRSTMKSMEIKDHEEVGTDNGWKSPWGRWWRFFAWTQTSQEPTNSFMNFQDYGHQYSRDTNSMVLLNPKWLATNVSCLACRTWNHAWPFNTYNSLSWYNISSWNTNLSKSLRRFFRWLLTITAKKSLIKSVQRRWKKVLSLGVTSDAWS